MKHVLALPLLALCVGCGGGGHQSDSGAANPPNDRILDGAHVGRAFRAAGLRRPQNGLLKLFETSGLNKKYGIEDWDSDPSSLSPSVVVEVFTSVRLARYAVSVGGNMETSNGEQVAPLARIGNVVVTIYPDASPADRVRALRAVRSLRRG